MSRCNHTERWYARHWHRDRKAGQLSQCIKHVGHTGPHLCERIEREGTPEPLPFKPLQKAYDVPRLTEEVLKLRKKVAGSVEACTVAMPTDGPGLDHELARLNTAVSLGGMMLHYERQRLTMPVDALKGVG